MGKRIGVVVVVAALVMVALPVDADQIEPLLVSDSHDGETLAAEVAQPFDDDLVKKRTSDVDVGIAPGLAAASQLLQDGSFEAGFPNPFWTDFSQNLPTTLCSISLCGTGEGTASPRSGNWWAWFGGVPEAETGRVAQSVAIPRGSATLSFYVWIGAATTTGSMTFDIDGDVLFSITEADIGAYGAYTLVTLDISAYADSAVHNLRFQGRKNVGDHLNISLDDVSLIVQPSGTFVDDDGNIFESDIEWLADEGITKGCNAAQKLFCPNDLVTRGQMAAFLVRALGYTDNGGGNLFVDDDGHTFENDIDKLGTAGVTKGCNPPVNDRFCPDDRVTRGAMAAFLVRALGYTDNGGGNLFIDDDGSTFENDIDRLATAGVTKGCNPPVNDKFCPDDFVTRGQMAAFLHRALG